LANQVLLFAVVGGFTVVLKAKAYAVPSSVTWLGSALLGLVVLLMLYGMVRKSLTYVWWEAVLLLMVYGGIWLSCLAVLPVWAAVIAAAFLTALPMFVPLTLACNSSMVVGAAGVGLLAAINLPMPVMLICAAGVAAYEFYRAQGPDLATLLSEAWHAGVVPGLLVPAEPKGWLRDIGAVWQPGQGVVAGFLPFVSAAAAGYAAASRGWLTYAVFIVAVVAGTFWFGRGAHGKMRWWIFPASSALALAAVWSFYSML